MLHTLKTTFYQYDKKCILNIYYNALWKNCALWNFCQSVLNSVQVNALWKRIFFGPFKRIECVGGWYGLECKQQCSGHCKDNAVCNHVTDQCVGGCAAGWKGALCDQGMQLYAY